MANEFFEKRNLCQREINNCTISTNWAITGAQQCMENILKVIRDPLITLKPLLISYSGTETMCLSNVCYISIFELSLEQ